VAPPSSGVLLTEGGGRYWRNPGTLARACREQCRRRYVVVVKTNFSA
jgi:hypothetical protein